MKNFNILGVHWKIPLLGGGWGGGGGGVHKKPRKRGGGGGWYPDAHYGTKFCVKEIKENLLHFVFLNWNKGKSKFPQNHRREGDLFVENLGLFF